MWGSLVSVCSPGNRKSEEVRMQKATSSINQKNNSGDSHTRPGLAATLESWIERSWFLGSRRKKLNQLSCVKRFKTCPFAHSSHPKSVQVAGHLLLHFLSTGRVENLGPRDQSYQDRPRGRQKPTVRTRLPWAKWAMPWRGDKSRANPEAQTLLLLCGRTCVGVWGEGFATFPTLKEMQDAIAESREFAASLEPAAYAHPSGYAFCLYTTSVPSRIPRSPPKQGCTGPILNRSKMSLELKIKHN